MKWRVLALLGLLLVTTALQTAAVTVQQQQPPPRLIAHNRTSYAVDVSAWNGQAWNFVARLKPSSWQAFPNAANGSMWRARFGQAVRDHRVSYVFDPSYGGYQSVWWIQ